MNQPLRSFLREVRADVERHEGLRNPACWPLLVHRIGRLAWQLPWPASALTSKVYGVSKLALEVTMGTVVHREMSVGKDLLLIHGTHVRLHSEAVLGDRVALNHDVTIGHAHNRTGAPRLGNDVLVGAGAKLIGPITVGDGATIASNSLVVTDVPAGATAMGVPARALPARPRSRPAAARAELKVVGASPQASANSSSESIPERSGEAAGG